MKCENCILLLDEYLNKELEENLRGSVTAHLDDCENCGMEIRLLEAESGFYQKIAAHNENNFSDQWEAMHNRLMAESLIKNDILLKEKRAENHSPIHFLSAFLGWLENSFFVNRTAFGIGLLIIIGFAAVFLSTNRNNSTDKKLIVANASADITKTKSVNNLPKTDVPQPKKANDANETKIIDKSNSIARVFQTSPAIADRKTTDISANSKKNEKLKVPNKLLENASNTNSDKIAVRLPVENMNSDFQTASDDQKMADYLNKVHLFLLMVRNLENDETINAVIGDKYQTEAQMFLNNNNIFKKESLKNKNIPAVELLNEIEPVLKAISNLSNQYEKNKTGSIAVMVKQTGIVFKLRLWMSNAKFDREKSL